MSDIRYQDFVIKDGRLVGQFDEMYQRCDDPWHQAAEANTRLSKSRHVAILNILKYGAKSVVEFGCGLGHFSNLIVRQTGAKVVGVDISQTAIHKAKSSFPEIDFVVDSVRNVSRYHPVDALLFAEITWYILDDLQYVFDSMLRHHRGKLFLHNLVFYKGETQQYGRDFFTSLSSFVEYCPFRLLDYCEASTTEPDSTIETSTVFRIEEK